MASITWRDGRATVQIVAPSGKRRTLALGRVGKRDAERCADDVESLNDLAKLGRRPSGELLERVDRFASDVKRKLVGYGVLPADLTDEPDSVPTLGPFAAGYVKVRSDVKPATATFYGHTERNLIEFFGSGKPLADVTAGDADEFRLWLLRAKPAKDAPKDTAAARWPHSFSGLRFARASSRRTRSKAWAAR